MAPEIATNYPAGRLVPRTRLESGKNEWWRFRHADGAPWGLAGLCNTWTDPATGEWVERHTMLSMNAASHPLMRRMHKLDPKYGPNEQDKMQCRCD